MPITLDVPENEPLKISVRRAGYWPRKIKVDGNKEKLLIRLAPIPGSGLAAPGKERTAKELGFEEGSEPAAETDDTSAEDTAEPEQSSEAPPAKPAPTVKGKALPTATEDKPAAPAPKAPPSDIPSGI